VGRATVPENHFPGYEQSIQQPLAAPESEEWSHLHELRQLLEALPGAVRLAQLLRPLLHKLLHLLGGLLKLLHLPLDPLQAGHLEPVGLAGVGQALGQGLHLGLQRGGGRGVGGLGELLHLGLDGGDAALAARDVLTQRLENRRKSQHIIYQEGFVEIVLYYICTACQI